MKLSHHEPTAKTLIPVSGAGRAWRKALGALGGPVLRLHHYRDVRTRVLRDAMQLSDRQRCGTDPEHCESAGH